MKSTLISKIEDGTARPGVVGLGYVGLPLTVEFAKSGLSVTGIELDERKVASINEGVSYVTDVRDEVLGPLVEKGLIKATTDYTVVSDLDTINICVPTPLRKTRDPDLSFIVESVNSIVPHLRKGQMIILESTTYPGTTEEVVLPILASSGLEVGVDFFLAFSPERVDPGNPTYGTRNVPKVVGGVTPQCTDVAKSLYRRAVEEVVPVSSTRVAEMVKLLENTYRSVNIGLVNEIALMCDRFSLDVWEVIEAAGTKPFGFMPFYPGPGLGGHCIPIDPFYLSWKARMDGFEARFIELAGQVNSNMPHFVISKVVAGLNDRSLSVKGSNILILGVAYKRNIADIRESPALDIIGLLADLGAAVTYSDPHVPEIEFRDVRLHSRDLTSEVLREANCVVLVADHDAFDYEFLSKEASLIIDTRNAFKDYPDAKVVKL